ncbi:hypothetical protein ECANGB1_1609 [Enterospora canceri]|uniref:Uncharacterized protein n=1 Tax=Enterospora canceri TaxID=1081671 RepID=A0A1Y1S5P9_9MICR|nr:hypothetical protein ECANGB1_1609 [Enterospora canceri]
MQNHTEIKASTPRLANGYSYITKNEMFNKMTEIAKDNSILRVIVNNERMVSFVCENNQCEAIINGVFNTFTGKYQIIRLNLNHKCSMNTEVVAKCIFNYLSNVGGYRTKMNNNMTIGELTNRLMGLNYSVGYFETYSFVQYRKNNESPGSLLNTTEIFGNVDFLVKNCLKEFDREFRAANPSFTSALGDDFYYFNNNEFSKYLRPVREIKPFLFSQYALILGIAFCPNDEPIIASVLLMQKKEMDSEKVKEKALNKFIQIEKSQKVLFLTEFDPVEIEALEKSQVEYLIKSHSLINFLDETDLDEIDPLDYFLLLNYPNIKDICADSRKLINLDPKHFLRFKSRENTFFLNNTRCSDFEFLCDEMALLDFFDFLNLLIWHIKEDHLERESEYSDQILSDNVLEIVHNNQLQNAIGDCDGFECTKYKETGIPCVHFFNSKAAQNENVENAPVDLPLYRTDPHLYASKYYHRNQLKNVSNIETIIKMGPAMYRNLKYKIKMIGKK